jgi:predicted transposase YdaD
VEPNDQSVMSQARRLLEGGTDALPSLEGIDLLETILVYRFPTLSREEIQKMLQIYEAEFRTTQFHKDVFLEGRLEGKQEGRLEGREEVLARARQLIIRQLTCRVGNLALKAVQQVEPLDLDALDALGEALLDFSHPTDLAKWLEASLSC